ncbi:MAG: LysM peptidoglycan-binding domain-containing protein [Clostridiales bacterium]|nr:LysM peptidoglycan-binding domain-containing protein [Clostridiales bacterium]
MKIVNLKRFLISMSLILLISLFSVNLAISSIITHGDDIKIYNPHTVTKGETIWSIASQYNQGDIRDLVYEIGIDNNLTNFVIIPGQILRIPIN